MHGTAAAPAASGTIELGYGDDEGNWPMVVEVSGLEPLPKGGYYELLLTKNGEPVVACGSFNVGDDGYANVRLGASYNLRNFDGWVVRPWVQRRDELNKTGRSDDLRRCAAFARNAACVIGIWSAKKPLDRLGVAPDLALRVLRRA